MILFSYCRLAMVNSPTNSIREVHDACKHILGRAILKYLKINISSTSSSLLALGKKIIYIFTFHIWNNQRHKQSSFYNNNHLHLIYQTFSATFCQYFLCLKIKKPQNFANLYLLCREGNISSRVSFPLPSLYRRYRDVDGILPLILLHTNRKLTWNVPSFVLA